jgi:hypothetical protein
MAGSLLARPTSSLENDWRRLAPKHRGIYEASRTAYTPFACVHITDGTRHENCAVRHMYHTNGNCFDWFLLTLCSVCLLVGTCIHFELVNTGQQPYTVARHTAKDFSESFKI